MPRRRSLVGPFVLIGLGLLLLFSSLRSNWSSWEVIWRYWPVLLIAWGVGKLWDHLRAPATEEGAAPTRFSGGELALALALLVLVALALTRHYVAEPAGHYHFEQTVQAQGAQAVHAEIALGAGELAVAGGAASLLEADCDYSRPSRKPQVTYRVSGTDGELEVRQPSSDQVEFGTGGQNHWTLRFNNQIPLDLTVQMGAGTGRMDLAGLDLTHLRIEGGVGTVTVDMSGDWKHSLDGRISGGVGTVTVRLPQTVGVRVEASGGLGAINAPGFARDGDAYVNGAYGKSPITLSLQVEGGLGTINLESAP